VRQLLRYTDGKRVILNFDADRAGDQAAERAIGEVANLAYQGEVQLRVLNIPSGKDPDEFLKTHGAVDYRDLLAAAPLWLDWQIQRALAGRDLKQADQLQQSTAAIVTLLGSLPNPTLRTHYIHVAAELLSQNNSRLVPQIEETLRLQVKGQRWHGRSQKWQTPGDRTLLLEAEAQLLRLYLHVPAQRAAIAARLEAQDLEFSLSHHRFLWRMICALEAAAPEAHPRDPLPAADFDLLGRLQDQGIEFPREMAQVYPLFQLDEKTQNDLPRAALVIRSAIASLEKLMCEKRYRHFLDLWQSTSIVETPELSQLYQQKAYAEQQRMQELDRQRQVNFVDLVQVPYGVEVRS
jgi:DNA primase